MSRDKQIEGMVKDICKIEKPCKECFAYPDACKAVRYAERFYHAGYRKASDVVSDIFEGVMQAIEEGTKNATSTLKQSITTHEKLLVSTGEMYSGFVGKAICQFFKKYESEGAE